MPGPKDGKYYRQLRNAGALSGIGTLFFASVVIGYYIGNFLDKKLGTEPWFMVFFVMMGSVAAFVEMIKLINSTHL